MGNDGGVIAVQRRFMRHGNLRKEDEKPDKAAVMRKRTTCCSLTDEPLQAPIVACGLGNLYNKEALIRRLLDRTLPEAFAHIRSLKDVVTCSFTANPALKTSSGAAAGVDSEEASPFTCPITYDEFNGRTPFCVLRSCGCVVSQKAIKAVKAATCPVCDKAFKSADCWRLVPSEDQLPEIRARLVMSYKKKKDKKLTSKAAQEGEVVESEATGNEHKRKRAGKRLGEGTAEPKRHMKSSSIVGKATEEALAAFKEGKEKSSVYSSLFSKHADKDANQLLMTVGGLRYSLH